MKLKRLPYVIVAVACLAVGALAGITGGSAATTKSTKARAANAQAGHYGRHGGPPPGGPPPVHSVSVVPNKEGTAFDTVTLDSGTVQSVSGQELTIDEGTKKLTYKTVTLTIPAGASVRRDGKTAQLGELQKSDHAIVFASSDGTTRVDAADSSFRPAGGMGHDRPGGPGGPGGWGGPPPGTREGEG
ncbi:MAG: hypothetical protein ACRDJ3_01600 [Solirubrobacteraceae bacterium]